MLCQSAALFQDCVDLQIRRASDFGVMPNLRSTRCARLVHRPSRPPHADHEEGVDHSTTG